MAGAKNPPALRGPVIATVQDLVALAELLYRGGCTPPGVDSPGKVAAVILAGLEVGLAPTQALGSIMLTGGKPTIYGDGAMALVRASGLLESIAESVTGDGKDRRSVVVVKRKGEPERTYSFSMADADKAGLVARANGKGPWATYPDRMLVMRARGFAFRDIFPDVLRGLTLAEEALDQLDQQPAPAAVQQVPPPPPPAIAAPPQPSANGHARGAEKVTAAQLARLKELQPHVLPPNLTDAEKRAAWAKVLEPFEVITAKDLTLAQAAELIDGLERKHCPFTHPEAASTGPAASPA